MSPRATSASRSRRPQTGRRRPRARSSSPPRFLRRRCPARGQTLRPARPVVPRLLELRLRSLMLRFKSRGPGCSIPQVSSSCTSRSRTRARRPSSIGGLGFPVVFNNMIQNFVTNRARTLPQAHEICSFFDPYVGRDAGYLQVTRLSGAGPALVVVPETGTQTPFEAFRPLNDASRRGQTFEGAFEWTSAQPGVRRERVEERPAVEPADVGDACARRSRARTDCGSSSPTRFRASSRRSRRAIARSRSAFRVTSCRWISTPSCSCHRAGARSRGSRSSPPARSR